MEKVNNNMYKKKRGKKHIQAKKHWKNTGRMLHTENNHLYVQKINVIEEYDWSLEYIIYNIVPGRTLAAFELIQLKYSRRTHTVRIICVLWGI